MRWISCLFLVVAAVPAIAQQTQRSPQLDVTIGAGYGWGGNYTERGAVAGEVMFAPSVGSSWIFAAALGGQSNPASGDKCLLGPTGTGCLPQFPAVAHLAILAGRDRVMPGLTLRALAGPAFFHGEDADGFGPVVRLDAATGVKHIAFVLAAIGGVDVKSHETLPLGSLQFGVRLR